MQLWVGDAGNRAFSHGSILSLRVCVKERGKRIPDAQGERLVEEMAEGYGKIWRDLTQKMYKFKASLKTA